MKKIEGIKDVEGEWWSLQNGLYVDAIYSEDKLNMLRKKLNEIINWIDSQSPKKK